MPRSVPDNHPLRRMFCALTEDAFLVGLGLADTQLTDYLSDLLARFVHVDTIYRLRSVRGKRLEEVAEMLAEAQGRVSGARREVHRQIGDFTLFFSGVYPESLERARSSSRKDSLTDYRETGKRSYWIASTFDDEPYKDEAPVLRRLSAEFETCAYGLSRVRAEWERLGETQQLNNELLS